MLAPFLSGLVFAMFMALVPDGVDQVLDTVSADIDRAQAEKIAKDDVALQAEIENV